MKLGDFNTLAKSYAARPAYSSFHIERLLRSINESGRPLNSLKIAEVGAGTGKLTKVLASYGMSIDAVEPSINMKEEGIAYTRECQNVTWHSGTGEETGLADDSYDLVMMASSFHWTDPNKSLPEFSRILKKGGYLSIIYNPRNLAVDSINARVEARIEAMLGKVERISSGALGTKDYAKILLTRDCFTDILYMQSDYMELFTQERYIEVWESVNDLQVKAGSQWSEVLEMIKEECALNGEVFPIPYIINSWTGKSTK